MRDQDQTRFHPQYERERTLMAWFFQWIAFGAMGFLATLLYAVWP